MPKVEKAIHLDALKLYMEMGGMSQAFLSEFEKKIGKSEKTAYRWEKELEWDARAKEPIDEAVEELKEAEKINAKEVVVGFLDLARTSLDGIDTKESYIDGIFGTAFDRIPTKDKPNPDNALEVKSIEDMRSLVAMQIQLINAKQAWIKTVLLLVGEPDSRPDVNVSVSKAIMEGTYYKVS